MRAQMMVEKEEVEEEEKQEMEEVEEMQVNEAASRGALRIRIATSPNLQVI